MLKENNNHKELSIEQYNEIIGNALYNADLIIRSKPNEKPNYYQFVKLSHDGKNVSSVIELNENKDNFEVVNWHRLENVALERTKKRASREGGQILITKRTSPQGAAALSALSVGNQNIDKNNYNVKSQYGQVPPVPHIS